MDDDFSVDLDESACLDVQHWAHLNEGEGEGEDGWGLALESDADFNVNADADVELEVEVEVCATVPPAFAAATGSNELEALETLLADSDSDSDSDDDSNSGVDDGDNEIAHRATSYASPDGGGEILPGHRNAQPLAGDDVIYRDKRTGNLYIGKIEYALKMLASISDAHGLECPERPAENFFVSRS